MLYNISVMMIVKPTCSYHSGVKSVYGPLVIPVKLKKVYLKFAVARGMIMARLAY